MGRDRLKAYRLTDFVIPSLILKNPEIEKAIYEDGAVFQIPDVVNEYWIGIETKEDGTIACYRVRQLGAVLWHGHAHVLPQYRRLSIECSKTALTWAFENIPKIEMVTSIIPETFPQVINHILSLGFVKAGEWKKSHVRDGKIVNQEIFTIDKKTVQGFS